MPAAILPAIIGGVLGIGGMIEQNVQNKAAMQNFQNSQADARQQNTAAFNVARGQTTNFNSPVNTGSLLGPKSAGLPSPTNLAPPQNTQPITTQSASMAPNQMSGMPGNVLNPGAPQLNPQMAMNLIKTNPQLAQQLVQNNPQLAPLIQSIQGGAVG